MSHTPPTRPRFLIALMLLCSALALGVAACGDDDEASSGSGSSSGKKSYKMTLIAGVKGDEFYITIEFLPFCH